MTTITTTSAALNPYDPTDKDPVTEATAAWLLTKSINTRTAYLRDLKSWTGFCQQRHTHPLTARKPDADLFGAWLQDPAAGKPLTATSTARRMAAVSSWYRYLVACDVHERNPFAAAQRPTIDRQYSATAWLDEAGAQRMIRAAEHSDSSTALRDTAMIRLMLQLGIRVSEVCRLDLNAFGVAKNQRTVQITGKGGKRISRALPHSAAEAIDDYLKARAKAAGVKPRDLTGYVFTTRTGRPVDRVEVFRLVRRLAERAGLAHPQSVTPHALRHTFATIATERGADLDDLQDAMGHADPRTTRRYQRAARRLERDPAHLVAAALG